ncbi:MAG: hypothetical protein NZM44_07555, partial [Candidatus Calescibacterium sp.]|nr:hypothetical protein [Candidatus Calescibacterium sp.]
MRLFYVGKFPCIESIELLEGGSLKCGTYFICTAYCDQYGNPITPYSSLYGPIMLTTRHNKEVFFGEKSTDDSGKAIKIKFSSIDLNYRNYCICVVRPLPEMQAKRIAVLNTNSDTFIFQDESVNDVIIPIEDIISEPKVYNTAKVISTKDNCLVLANLSCRQDIPFQLFANQIKTRYVVKRVKVTDLIKDSAYYSPDFALKYSSFMRDEVYALGIRLVYKDFTKSRVFHIPGRRKNLTSDGIPFSAPDQDPWGENLPHGEHDTNMDGVHYIDNLYNYTERWQVYNTARRIDFHQDYIDYLNAGGNPDTYEGLYAYGELGYHESNITYPNNPMFGDLCGQKIRHHRIPDCTIEPITDIKTDISNTPEEMPDYVYLIGLEFRNINIDPNLFPDVIGYEILIGDRTHKKTILDKGMCLLTYFHDSGDDIFSQDSNIAIKHPYYYVANEMHSKYGLPSNWNGYDILQFNKIAFIGPKIYINGKLDFKPTILKIERKLFGKRTQVDIDKSGGFNIYNGKQYSSYEGVANFYNFF